MDLVERSGIVTTKQKPLTLLGPDVRVGDPAPDFRVVDGAFQPVRLSDFAGYAVLISAVPSLDTGVCALQTKRFNDEVATLPKDVIVLTVSMDLPFAQKRFCDEFEINKVKTFSDHRDASFGTNYGVLIKELRLLARAIFLLDKNDNVKYVEYVKEMGNPPNYNAALAALKSSI